MPNFDLFSVDFDFVALAAGTSNPSHEILGYSNGVGGYGAGSNYVGVYCVDDNWSGIPRLTIVATGSVARPLFQIVYGTSYFLRFRRDALNSVSLFVFSDANRTIQVPGSPFVTNISPSANGMNQLRSGNQINGSNLRTLSATVDNITFCQYCPLLAIPVFSTAPSNAVCAGTAVNYSINAVPNSTSYEWRIDGNLVNVSAVPNYLKTWTNVEAGNHVVTVVAKSACATSAALTANVTVTATPVVAAITGNNNVCVGQYLPLDNATANGVWASSNTAVATVSQKAVVTGVSAGTANITYTVTNGACATAITQPITVNATADFNISGNSSVCPDSYNPYSINPVAASTRYYWIVDNGIYHYEPNGTATQTYVNFPSNAASSYTIKAVAVSDLCKGSTIEKAITVNVSTNVPPAPNMTCSAAITGNDCPSLSVTNNAGYTVQWNVGGTLYNNVTSVNRTAGQNVTVKYTSTAGCTKSIYRNSNTICNSFRLADEIDLSSDKPFAIYPNPAKGAFVIQTKGQNGVASIYDVTGHLVKVVDLYESLNSYNVEISTTGVYTIKIQSGSETKGYKIVVE